MNKKLSAQQHFEPIAVINEIDESTSNEEKSSSATSYYEEEDDKKSLAKNESAVKTKTESPSRNKL